MTDIEQIAKLAASFEQNSESRLFADLNWHGKAKELSLLSGRMFHKAKEEQDPKKAEEIKRAAQYVLFAADILKAL